MSVDIRTLRAVLARHNQRAQAARAVEAARILEEEKQAVTSLIDEANQLLLALVEVRRKLKARGFQMGIDKIYDQEAAWTAEVDLTDKLLAKKLKQAVNDGRIPAEYREDELRIELAKLPNMDASEAFDKLKLDWR